MQLVDKPIMSDQDLSMKDLGPLSWVIEELRKSFDVSIKGLKRFINDANATQSDWAAIDTNLLRVSKQNLHQISGALKLLEIDESAVFVEAMEAVAGRFVQRPALVIDESVTKLEYASFAVLEYLECLLATKNVSSIGLFSQYRDIKLLAGSDRAHPADLWIREPFQWLQPIMPVVQTLDYSPGARDALDSALLRVMTLADTSAANELCHLSLSLAQSQRNEKAATFWKVSAAFFEAVAQKLIPVDIYVKRSAAGIVIHYNNLKHGDWVFSDKFMQNMLFLCQQAKIEKEENSPYLLAVQKTWALSETNIVDYEKSQFGRFDPALLALSKKRIIVAKELWTSLSGGDIQKIRGTSEQFKLVAESLVKLYPSSQPLAQALVNASDLVVVNKQAPSAEFAMEVATAILYLEAVFEGWDSTDSVMELRANKLAQRIDNIRNGGQAENVEPWIEELYRRISDRESLGSVVGELRICLTDVEKSIDKYFRSPSMSQVLQAVPSKLSQMRGILSVLGLDEAVSAAASMRDQIEEFESHNYDFERARVAGVFDKFASNLGALGFLIDMLNYQPALVKKLFVFDVKTGCLNLLMGRERQIVSSYAPEALTEDVVQNTLQEAHALIDAPVAVSLPVQASALLAAQVTAQAVEKIIKAQPVVAQKPTEEYELRDIFLDEAADVVETGLAAAKSLLKTPENFEQQSTLRRAFHTLKGSARMVGFDDFGEAGWSFEQVINTRLTDQAPFDDDICALAIAALNAFEMWVKDLRLGNSTQWNSQTFKFCADAMRIEGRLDTTGLISSATVKVKVKDETEFLSKSESQPESESDDEAFLRSLANFELLELPVVDLLSNTPTITHQDDAATSTLKTQDDAVIPTMVASFVSSGEIKAVAGQELVAKEDAEEKEKEKEKVELEVEVEVEVVEEAAVGLRIAPVADEEKFKIIGALKIGIPLYNVYLNEADEWSRCLVTELDEWAIEFHKPLNISTVNFAHSLAGSSATVGFHQLSGLAKQLEKALDKVYLKSSGTETEAAVFAQVAEECRRLLHQFAAGFLEEPKASVVALLSSLKLPETPRVAAVSSNVIPLQKTIEPSKSKQPDIVEVPVQVSMEADLDGVPSPIAHHVVQNLDIDSDNDDDIELVDSLDPDLFHIFEEEARDLLPKLGGALRQWASNPEDLDARSEVLRTLHTLKGSSRLAGAMRLGELSHRMESEIESIGSENLTTGSVEPLLSKLDNIQSIFELIIQPDEAASATDLEDEEVSKIDLHETETLSIQAAEVISFNASSVEVDSVKVSQSITQIKTAVKPPASSILKSEKRESRQSVRVRARLLDRLVNQAGEVMLTRTRIESELGQLRGSLGDLTGNLDRLRQQLRDVELQAETQMQSRMEQAKDSQKSFDPLEFDRFTRVQELTRMMAESVNDVATVQRNLQRAVDSTEDDLVAQARQTRDLQRDLLRTRMEEFESISDRLYRVVRQASKDAEKQVKLDIVGGSIEMDRGVLERMTPSFEHLLRNCIAHGLESADKRLLAGKEAVGVITITLLQDGNDVIIEFGDDGLGLNYQRIRAQAIAQKIIDEKDALTDAETVNLIFTPGLSTASQVTELSGRGIGLDVVRAEVIALGGRIDVSSVANKGTKFKLILPLTTAVTQVVMMRAGSLSFGVPSHLVEVVRRSQLSEVEKAYTHGFWGAEHEHIPFYWSGALLQASQRSNEPLAKTNPVVIFRSAGQRVALHVDEIFGNKEVVIKNLGPQLARLPGLAGMAILVSGAVALIYNPVALASVYGASVQQYSPIIKAEQARPSFGGAVAVVPAPTVAEQQTPLILVVDDSITVRRVTQRMLLREGFRVVLAIDGLNAIEKLNLEIPAVVLSDIEMPRMDGFDLVRNIRADSKLKHLPVVMITSRIAEKHRELAMELGVNDYLGKPYSEEGLLAVLRKHTAKKLEEFEKV
jgi:chemosensory pili system protein ChpA (sensor histidine kinase/response regulator)